MLRTQNGSDFLGFGNMGIYVVRSLGDWLQVQTQKLLLFPIRLADTSLGELHATFLACLCFNGDTWCEVRCGNCPLWSHVYSQEFRFHGRDVCTKQQPAFSVPLSLPSSDFSSTLARPVYSSPQPGISLRWED